MGFIIIDYTGTVISAVSFLVTDITEKKVSRVIVRNVPTANFDVIQQLGYKNKVFTISGTIFNNVDTRSADFRNMIGKTGSISGSDDRGQTYLPQTQVIFSNVEFDSSGRRPFERKFTLEAVEVI